MSMEATGFTTKRLSEVEPRPTMKKKPPPPLQRANSLQKKRKSNADKTHIRSRSDRNVYDSSFSVFSGFSDLHQSIKETRTNKNEILTNVDHETIQQMGRNYSRSHEEWQIRTEARAAAVDQSMYLALVGMIVFQTLAIIFFIVKGGLTVPDAILFALYSTTTAGFGSVEIPFDPAFLIFVIVYMFAAIAALTTLVAEMYMYIAIKTSNVKKAQDPINLLKQKEEQPETTLHDMARHPELVTMSPKILTLEEYSSERDNGRSIGRLLSIVSLFKRIYRSSELGRIVIIVLYLGMLLLVGAIAMMFLENWTFIQALYFSTFVMTTVGYGDLRPSTTASTWFVIFWVPFNVSFVSIYMGNLARHYMMICKANTDRNYKNLHQKYITKADEVELNVSDNASDGGPSGAGQSAQKIPDLPQGRTIQAFGDVLRFVLENVSVTDDDRSSLTKRSSANLAQLLSLPHPWESEVFQSTHARIPSFVTLVLVQERIANIIAEEVAGYQTEVTSKDVTLIMSFDGMDEISNKWLIPSAVEEAFRQTAFEAILYIGENRLVTLGVEAFLQLPPSEVFDILSPLVAAMADAGTMASWLARTEELASIHYPRARYEKRTDLGNAVGYS